MTSSPDIEPTGDPDPFASTRAIEAGPAGTVRYRFLRAIDEGGMGEVFLAFDTELNREVVVKRPKRDPRRREDDADEASREEQRQRFLREIRVGAILEHPGILPVYDVGDERDGFPFGVMRYLPEGTLHRLVRDYHRDHPTTIDEVSFRALLVHFAAACRAIAYAHSRGVIHLDLKPRNVVTGKFGETQVIDWGVAWIEEHGLRQRVEDSEGSRSGSGSEAGPSSARSSTPRGFRGTRAYASPEQWNEDWTSIGPRSDVYGLGATLHEVLAGLAPFDSRSPIPREDILGGHLHRQPKPWAPRELVAIARKAMAVDPRERYGGAALVADDVDRFLADEPVSACRDPWRTRVRRFVKRHRTPVAVAAALVATSALALGIGFVAVSRQRDVALRNLDTARRVIRGFCVEIGDDFWSVIPKSEPRRVAMMETAVAHYRQLRADHPSDAVVLRDSADAARRLANLLRVTGRVEEALPLFDEALADLAGVPDDDVTWRDRLETRSDRDLALASARGDAAALPSVEETHALASRYQRSFPSSRFAACILARTTADMARAMRAGGRPDEAARLFEDALSVYRQRIAQGDPYAADLKNAAAAAVDAAACSRALGNREAAIRAAADAGEWVARLTALGADDPNHRLLGAMAIREALLAGGDAADTIDAAIASVEDVVAEHPDAPQLSIVLAETLLHAAAEDLNRGDYDTALARAARAVSITGNTSDRLATETRASALYFRGAAEALLGRVGAAQGTLREALAECGRAEERGVAPERVATLRSTIETLLDQLP